MRHLDQPYRVRSVSFRDLVDFRDVNPENTVPVLVADGRRICGSADIMAWLDAQRPDADLYPHPEVTAWEAWADETIGPIARRLAYRTLYEHPHRFTRNPAIWAMGRIGRPLVLQILRHAKARRHYEADEAALPGIFDRVAKQLGDQEYLFGDLSAADFAVAALIEPLLAIRGPETTHAAVPRLRRYVAGLRRARRPARPLSGAQRAAIAALPA